MKVDALTLGEDFRMLKNEVFAHINGATAGQVAGLLLGICNGSLSAAEIAESIVADGPVNPDEVPQKEHAMRAVWLIGATRHGRGIADETEGAFEGENGGPLMVVKPRWTFNNPAGWDYFVFNNSGTVLTTGADIRLVSTVFGLWVQ